MVPLSKAIDDDLDGSRAPSLKRRRMSSDQKAVVEAVQWRAKVCTTAGVEECGTKRRRREDGEKESRGGMRFRSRSRMPSAGSSDEVLGVDCNMSAREFEEEELLGGWSDAESVPESYAVSEAG